MKVGCFRNSLRARWVGQSEAPHAPLSLPRLTPRAPPAPYNPPARPLPPRAHHGGRAPAPAGRPDALDHRGGEVVHRRQRLLMQHQPLPLRCHCRPGLWRIGWEKMAGGGSATCSRKPQHRTTDSLLRNINRSAHIHVCRAQFRDESGSRLRHSEAGRRYLQALAGLFLGHRFCCCHVCLMMTERWPVICCTPPKSAEQAQRQDGSARYI